LAGRKTKGWRRGKITAAPRRSLTQYTTFTECGWKYKLKYIDRVEEDPALWLAGGTSFHRATETFDRLAWADTPHEDFRADTLTSWHMVWPEELDALRAREPDETKWRTAGRKTKEQPNGQDVAWWADQGPVMCNRYVDWRIAHADVYDIATLPDGQPAVEFGGEVTAGDTPLTFYPDVLFVDRETGATVVVDKKTGATMPSSTMQLGKYARWVEKKYNIRVWYGAYYDARRGTLEPPRLLDRWRNDMVNEMYETLDRAIEAKVFLPNIRRECRGCGHRRHCKWQPGVVT
jgi:hypothetical protein